MADLINFNVPILGKPCEVFGGTVSTVIKCSCDPANPPVLIPSHMTIVACDKCRKAYQIIACNFDATKGHQQVMVAVAVIGTIDEQGHLISRA